MCMEGQEIPWETLMPAWQQDLQKQLGQYAAGKVGHMATPYEGPLGYGYFNESGKMVAPDENMLTASKLMNRLLGNSSGYTPQSTFDFHQFPSASKSLKKANYDPKISIPDEPFTPFQPVEPMRPMDIKDRFNYDAY